MNDGEGKGKFDSKKIELPTRFVQRILQGFMLCTIVI